MELATSWAPQFNCAETGVAQFGEINFQPFRSDDLSVRTWTHVARYLSVAGDWMIGFWLKLFGHSIKSPRRVFLPKQDAPLLTRIYYPPIVMQLPRWWMTKAGGTTRGGKQKMLIINSLWLHHYLIMTACACKPVSLARDLLHHICGSIERHFANSARLIQRRAMCVCGICTRRNCIKSLASLLLPHHCHGNHAWKSMTCDGQRLCKNFDGQGIGQLALQSPTWSAVNLYCPCLHK